MLSLPNHQFYEKQWETVAGFWFNRVLKERPLQHLAVADIVDFIQKDIEKRWQAKRAEQALYKRKKRLLAERGPAGPPSTSIVLTNVCDLATYEVMSDADKSAILKSVVQRTEELSKSKVHQIEVLKDEGPISSSETSTKRARVEASPSDEPTPPPFDDRLAFVLTLDSKEKAALSIAQLHGSRFDGRSLVCMFWSWPTPHTSTRIH